MEMKDFLRAGNVTRNTFPTMEQLPLYVGSGAAGGCIDGLGWMHADAYEGEKAIHNRALRYRTYRHFYRGEHAVDMMAALYHIGYKEKPELTGEYEQMLDLYTATVSTRYQLKDGTGIKVSCFSHPEHPHVRSFVYEYEGNAPDVYLFPEYEVEGHYGQFWHGDVTLVADGFDVRTNQCHTAVRLRVISDCGSVTCETDGEAIRLRMSQGRGRHLITVLAAMDEAETLAAYDEMTSMDSWIASARRAWRECFGESFVALPDAFVSKMTARALYVLLSSFSAQKSPASPPMGYTGYGWPFHFPQDISYIHPALLRLGKIEHAKRIVEHYRETLSCMEQVTHRIYGGHGAMWAWIYPLGENTEYLHDGAPNICYYEIHNAAYPARMAYETAIQAKDEEWTQGVALPIIRASAEFYASHLTKCEAGTWDLQVTPSMSQDEFALPNHPNYLCALYAERYCFWAAGKLGETAYAHYLEDGLSFQKLSDPVRGLYRTSEGMEECAWGQAKHPVQLNPLTFLPFAPNDAEKNAYALREEICTLMKGNFSHGWTSGSFWLAAAHMEDGEELYRELHRAEDERFHDADLLAFYETTSSWRTPYFVTAYGLWMQAVLDAFVSDYFGEVRIEGAVPDAWRGAEYRNLYTKDGECHSGRIE